jgi:hypothetical protein
MLQSRAYCPDPNAGQDQSLWEVAMPDRSRSPVALLMLPAWVMKCVIGSRNFASLLRTRNVLELWNSETVAELDLLHMFIQYLF